MARMKDIEGVKTGNLFKVHPAKLEKDPEFNIRLKDEDYYERREKYAQLYAAGKRPPPLLVYTIDERIIIIDGHVRVDGALLAIEWGVEIRDIDCVLQPGNDADRIVSMLNSGGGRGWQPIELLTGYKRLRGLGWTEKEIAASVGKTEQHVRGVLDLGDADTAVQQMVRSGSISATEAIREVRKSGSAATGNLTAAVDKAHAAGKTRATAKHIAQAKGAPSGSSVFAAARNSVLEEAGKIADDFAARTETPFARILAEDIGTAIRAMKVNAE
jgi:ParB family transcriptional regulator, chromosome partitioning protein